MTNTDVMDVLKRVYTLLHALYVLKNTWVGILTKEINHFLQLVIYKDYDKDSSKYKNWTMIQKYLMFLSIYCCCIIIGYQHPLLFIVSSVVNYWSFK